MCIEVGCILFSVALRQPVIQLSFVLPCLANPAQDVNGIQPALTTLGPEPAAGLALFERLLEKADAVVAHNSDFDRQWFGRGLLPEINKPWICTMADVPWPPALRLKGRPSVTALALAHGVPVWAAHRALTDCIYLAQVFERQDDLPELLETAMLPRFTYQALVSYDERHLAKEAGFSWDSKARIWTRRMQETETAKLGFATRKVS